MEQFVTLDDLKQGKVARIRERTFKLLTGEGSSTAQKKRVKGIGCPYRKDELGNIWYYAEDVIKYLESAQPCTSTSNYLTIEHAQRLEKARRVLTERQKK